WQKIDGTFYYLKDNGEMQGAGWAQIKGSWYHFDAKGGMQTGWQSIDGKNYYLGQDGAMKTGLVDGRYLSSSGAECRKIRVEITGYCPCNSCGGGRTASGKEPRDGITIAAPTELGFGTKIVIPGYTGNNCYVVEDRGGAIKKVGDVYKIDIFKSNHKAALDVGRRYFDAYIVE
ncbi:Putative cell wall binding repeat-containing protein, partial [Clostridium cavendishii DSM 21758]